MRERPMRTALDRRSFRPLLAALASGVAAIVSACGAGSSPSVFSLADDPDAAAGANGPVGSFGGGGGRDSGGPSGPTVPCPAGLTCNVACSDGGTTTLSGKVFDPAGKNPLYGAAVFVPATPLTPLPRGVPTGAEACSCAALFPSGALTSATTAVDGTFTLTNVPVGVEVPLVVQIGKWRRLVKVPVTACTDNPQPDRSLTLPGTVPAGDTDDNMPDIAVSTGEADSLECLMKRMGVPDAEYVAGAATGGHVHVFSGGGASSPKGIGKPEKTPMPGAPSSPTDLWAQSAQLMPYDVVLLSCEGAETYDANPPALEEYLNAGGRVFASHYHYAWFSGPINAPQGFTAPGDWGSNLATWSGGKGAAYDGVIGGSIVTTLNGGSTPFPKGVALKQWLSNVGALGQNGMPADDLSIYQPRFNATVAPVNASSQAWISSDASWEPGMTMYFSFDTPVNAPAGPDGGPPNYCGRAVFSDLHVAGDPSTADTSPPPAGCQAADLSPQERALEFMLFDLSSCVIPDNVAPPTGVPTPLK